MTSGRNLRTMVAVLAILGGACSSNTPAGSKGSGGGPGTGGASSQGGTSGSGGVTSSGGVTASGGQPGTGGSIGTGGRSGSGGATSAGGTSGSGGQPGTGGAARTGGRIGSGGSSAVGGATGQGGEPGTGGATATGGTTGPGGQPGSGGASAGGGATSQGTGGAGTGGRSGTGGGGGTAIDGGGTGDVKPSAGCGKTPTLLKSTPPPNAKISYNKITSAGLSRQYILWYPDNYDKNRPYRLILNYHWYTGSASQVFDCNTESIKCYTTQTPFFGHLALAENSTIFVAPDGIDAGWANTNGRDTTLTDDILKQVEEDLCIDTTRVFAQGFSYGGAMSATLACQRADVFRAVAVYAGGISGMSGACTGSIPIAYYGATGTQDSGYSGGQTAVQHFAQVNGCTAQTLPEPPTGGHVCISYEGCSAGHPTRWCPFDDIHTPSPRDKGQSTTWQPKEVWTFFTQF